MYQLYRRGIMVGQPPQGVPEIDLIVLDESARVIKNLQVKTTTRGARGGWPMNEKHETRESANLMYVFVDMSLPLPECYIIPSRVVARAVKASHKAWLSKPGKDGHRRNENPMRKIRPAYPSKPREFPSGWMDEFRERWDLLHD